MMFSYPYFGFPHTPGYSRYGYRYPNAPYYSNRTPSQSSTANKGYMNKNNMNYSKHDQEQHNIKKGQKPLHTVKKLNPIVNEAKREEPSSLNEDSPLFQIFGMNLYFDDILLICLIFFLYQEGVKDESLFIALILLLLS